MPNCIRCHKPIDTTPFCPLCGAKQSREKTVKARANGTGTAYKRGRTWTACIVVGYYIGRDGKMHKHTRSKGGFKTKTAALEYCAALKNEQEPKTAPMLIQYWDTYSRTAMDKLSDSKRQAYSIAWNKCTAIATKPVNTITVADLRQLVAVKCKTYYPARDLKSLLTHLFRLAAADGHANKDLPSFIELPAIAEKERMPFTDEEQALLWESYDKGDHNAAIPLIMIATGMMPGEMRRLSVDMIRLYDRKIVNVGIKTKVRKELSIILPDDICPVIEDVMEGKTGLLYPITEQAFYDRYYAALEKAGITRHLTPYSCRHTTATRHTINEHTPPQVVARLMRWSSTKMLDRYVHPTDQAAQEAANAITRPQKKAEKK